MLVIEEVHGPGVVINIAEVGLSSHSLVVNVKVGL